MQRGPFRQAIDMITASFRRLVEPGALSVSREYPNLEGMWASRRDCQPRRGVDRSIYFRMELRLNEHLARGIALCKLMSDRVSRSKSGKAIRTSCTELASGERNVTSTVMMIWIDYETASLKQHTSTFLHPPLTASRYLFTALYIYRRGHQGGRGMVVGGGWFCFSDRTTTRRPSCREVAGPSADK